MLKLADYSQEVTDAQLDQALRDGAFDAVFHYLGGNFALHIETTEVVTGIRSRNWPQMGIFVPTLNAVNGPTDAQTALTTYSFPLFSRHFLDIEPDEFNSNKQAWPTAANQWCDAIRSAGLSPGIYGTPDTVAACGNHADAIWIAEPDQCDPTLAPLDPMFFAGRRAIQCSTLVVGGVDFDVSFGQFPIGGTKPMTVSAKRPDGGTDYYTLVGQTVTHTVANFDGIVTFRDTPPGTWTTLLFAGYHGNVTSFFTGIDLNGAVFECFYSGGWQLAAKP